MEVLYLLIAISFAMAIGGLAFYAWAVHSGQYDDLRGESERILVDDNDPVHMRR